MGLRTALLLVCGIAAWLTPTAASRRLLQTGIAVSNVSFAGPDGVTLTGVRYDPANFASGSNFPALVMMHGCSGMWSNKDITKRNADGTPDLQNHLEKWGRQMASSHAVALAVDSFTPRGLLSPADQDQCGGTSIVDPYITRPLDARAAFTYLTGLGGGSKVDSAKVGLLGWSHGAQAVMVEAAETNRTLNVARAASDHKFAACVAFYPGCGTALKFGASLASSFWRPHRAMQLNVGTADGFFANCSSRANTARAAPYGAVPLTFPDLQAAPHSFDAYNQTWPTSRCATEPPTGEECAMRATDLDSFAFFRTQLGLP